MFGIPVPAVQLGSAVEDGDVFNYSTLMNQRNAENASDVFLFNQAFAQDSFLSYADLKERLTSTNDILRVQARRYLEGNFARYQKDVLPELFAAPLDSLDNGDYVASLISGLIAGIDAAADPPGSLSPGQRRDLSRPLPYISGHEKQLVALNEHSSDAVKQQARRLVSRFPYDSFKEIYLNLMAKAADKKCDSFDAGVDNEGVIYSGIFYFYNRIIQLNYNVPALSDEDIQNADNIGKMVHAAAKNCLPTELATDAALIDYGRATVYNEDGGRRHTAEAKAAAQDFLTSIKGNESSYFLPSHIATMRKLGA